MTGNSGQDPRPLSELLSELTAEVSTLVRQELQLAKVELPGEATMAAKGARRSSPRRSAGCSHSSSGPRPRRRGVSPR